jgi:hypothetical protein
LHTYLSPQIPISGTNKKNNDYKDAKDNVDHHILLTGNLICFVCYEHVRSYPLHNFAVKIRK